MEHIPVRVSVCSQKGGVGKSSLTVLVASWLHYVMKRNVLVVDCDFPQWSIHTQRERELHVLEHSDYFKLMLLRQFRSSQRKLWPVVKTTPAEALDDAERFMAQERYAAELVLFDLPGTVGTEGVFSLACNMDYLFIPLKADKMVVESSLGFIHNLRQVVIKGADRLREVRLFWTMVDRRERTPLYDRYTEAIERLGIHLLTTQIAYRSKFNKELLADGAGIGRSTLLAAERSFARDAGIEALAQEILPLVIPE